MDSFKSTVLNLVQERQMLVTD